MAEFTLHTVKYATVYANGWENPGLQDQSHSDNPAQCAKNILTRLRSDNIVGVRIIRIDDEYIDQVFME